MNASQSATQFHLQKLANEMREGRLRFYDGILGRPVLCSDSTDDLIIASLKVFKSMGICVLDALTFRSNLELQLYCKFDKGEWKSDGRSENWVAQWLDHLRYLLHWGDEPIHYRWLEPLLESDDFLWHHFAFLSFSASHQKRISPIADAKLVQLLIRAIERNPRLKEFFEEDKSFSYWYGIKQDESPAASLCRGNADPQVADHLTKCLRQDFVGAHAIEGLKAMDLSRSYNSLAIAFLKSPYPARLFDIDDSIVYGPDYMKDTFMHELSKLIQSNAKSGLDETTRSQMIQNFHFLTNNILHGLKLKSPGKPMELDLYGDLLKINVLINVLPREKWIYNDIHELAKVGISSAVDAEATYRQ